MTRLIEVSHLESPFSVYSYDTDCYPLEVVIQLIQAAYDENDDMEYMDSALEEIGIDCMVTERMQLI